MCIDVSDTLYNIPQFSVFFSFHSEEWKRNGSGMLDAFAHWQIGWQKVYYLITAEFSHLFDSFQFAP